MLIFVTGSRDSGKTAWLAAIARGLKALGAKPAGIISPAMFVKGRKTRYFAQSLASGAKRHLLDLSPNGPATDRRGFAFANRALARAAGAKIVFIDEFGPLELAGGGFMPQALRAARRERGITIIAVRKSITRQARRALNAKPNRTVDLDKKRPAPERFAKWLLR